MNTLSKPKPEFKNYKELTKRVNTLKQGNGKKEKGLVREILLVKNSDLGIVPYYLNNLKRGDSEFTLHVKQGFKLISEMRPNLLRKEYWLISDHGSMGGVRPPKYNYDYELLDKYLNHVLITSNFSVMEGIVSEGFYIPLNYNGKEYMYTPRFITTLDYQVYADYIKTRLEGLYPWKDLEYIISYITKTKHLRKDLINVVDSFAKNYRNPLKETVNNLKEDISFTINRIVKSLLLKEKTDKWMDNLVMVLEGYGEVYLSKAVENNVENAMKLKTLEHIPDKDQYKVRYMKTYIDKVDMLDIVYLKAIVSKKEDFRITLGKLVKYVNTPTQKLIENYRGGL